MKLLIEKINCSCRTSKEAAGFTLVEMLVVVFMIGVLSAIAIPNWLSFMNRQQVNKANDIILAALQQAQREAKRQKLSYSVSFQYNNNIPQIAVYRSDLTPTNYWQSLGTDLGISPGSLILGTNLTGVNTTTSSTSVSYPLNSSVSQTITFDYTGALNLPVTTNTGNMTAVQQQNLGYNSSTQNYRGLIVGVAIAKSPNVRRCVIVKTLIGVIQTGKDTNCS
jgi:prepilin-type N-terminal cleavage/methylation domain-containing protein